MLHLHQQLAVELSSDATDRKSLQNKSFDELSLLVTEHATKLVSNLRWMGEKVAAYSLLLRSFVILVNRFFRVRSSIWR